MNAVNPEIVSESVDSNRAEFDIRVPADLYYLQGHFPGEPVLPGVIQVHWAIHLADEHFDLKPSFAGFEALKFHRIIKPETPLRLVLELNEESGKLTFSYSSESGKHSQGRVLFE
jgi:3-hydroxymyristoyl/3-hydroxydecanoyl-(acyl carrier protein) dehydratase